MSEPVPIISKSLGLNTLLDPFQPQEPTDLAKAVDVRISDSSSIETAIPVVGLLSLAAGHSLFCDKGDCIIHDGGSMYQLYPSMTLSPALRSGMSGERVDHTQFGHDIYYSNKREHGIVSGGVNLPWSAEAYVGERTTRQFENVVPFFNHVAMFNGTMLGAIDNALFASVQFLPGLWEMIPVWMSDTDILMIKPVYTDGAQTSGGVFVSDRKATYFLSGLTPVAFTESKAADYPALEWSVATGYVPISKVFKNMTGNGALWVGANAHLTLGLPSGVTVNLTEARIAARSGYTAGATLIKGQHIISTLR